MRSAESHACTNLWQGLVEKVEMVEGLEVLEVLEVELAPVHTLDPSCLSRRRKHCCGFHNLLLSDTGHMNLLEHWKDNKVYQQMP